MGINPVYRCSTRWDFPTPSMEWAIKEVVNYRTDRSSLQKAAAIEVVCGWHEGGRKEDEFVDLKMHMTFKAYDAAGDFLGTYHEYPWGVVPESRERTTGDCRQHDGQPPVSQAQNKKIGGRSRAPAYGQQTHNDHMPQISHSGHPSSQEEVELNVRSRIGWQGPNNSIHGKPSIMSDPTYKKPGRTGSLLTSQAQYQRYPVQGAWASMEARLHSSKTEKFRLELYHRVCINLLISGESRTVSRPTRRMLTA
jgi:hypothetical protein